MNRSEFLKSLGLGVGGLVLPKTSFINSRRIKIYDNYVRGLYYYKFNEVQHQLKEGDALTLIRNRENVHDLMLLKFIFKTLSWGI